LFSVVDEGKQKGERFCPHLPMTGNITRRIVLPSGNNHYLDSKVNIFLLQPN